MNQEQWKGKWNQIKGDAKIRWGELTDDDFDKVEGHRDRLVGKIQEAYGKSKEEAEKEVSAFERECKC